MTEAFQKQIEQEARQAVTELLAEAKLKKGDVFVVGCSSSEIVGAVSYTHLTLPTTPYV